LEWAASVWRHEMEFGWREVDAAPADNFADFLRQLLTTYPTGPCTAAMAPYIDHCSFIGKLETLSRDLGMALREAGEVFDPAVLDVAPVNVSSNPMIRGACVAPHDLLAAFLEADAAFCERFGYADVPMKLVGAFEGSPWPKLRSNPAQSADPALPLSRTRYAYQLDDGSKTQGDPCEQRLQWALVKAINGVERPGRTAVVSEVDPYAAHLLSAKPGARVTFVPADERVTPKRLMLHLDGQPAVVDFRSFHTPEVEEDFDTIMLLDSADLSGALEGELLLTAKRVKPGGELLLVAPMLWTDLAISTTFDADSTERQGQKLVYRSLAEWRTVLGNCGFEAVTLVDSFDDPPPDTLLLEVESLATALGVDPGHLLGKAVLSARRSTGERPAAARDLWVRRRMLNLAEGYDSLPAAVEARLLMLESQVKTERLRRAQAEQGVIDRGTELLAARRDAHALLVELDFHVDELRRAREQHQSAQAELDILKARAEQGAIDRGAELLAARRDMHVLLVELEFRADELRRAQARCQSTQAELDALRSLLAQLGYRPEASSCGMDAAANDPSRRSAGFSPTLKSRSQGS